MKSDAIIDKLKNYACQTVTVFSVSAVRILKKKIVQNFKSNETC